MFPHSCDRSLVSEVFWIVMSREVAFSKTMYLWYKVCFRCCTWLCFGREPEALLFLKRKEEVLDALVHFLARMDNEQYIS